MPDIRVLIVDDSALMRELLGDMLRAAPGVAVAGVAKDGAQALEMALARRPDVVTLDVQMPNMDGLETLSRLLALYPVPVIMVSSLTQAGATTTLEALDRGALDYIAKPESASAQADWAAELLRKIRCIAGCDVTRILRIRKERRAKAHPAGASGTPRGAATVGPPRAGLTDELADKCIAIGISTGGPPALSQLFENFRPPLPPIVIVQHMPPNFTAPFAWRLNSLASIGVKEAAHGDVLRPNQAYIAPGGKHMLLRRVGSDVHVHIRDGEPVSGHKPSVDVLMRSAAEVYGPNCLGVIMTGMGRDGVDGCAAIRAAGGYVLGQDEQSSDVYGMNKVAFVEGHVDRQFSLNEGAAVITKQALQMRASASVR